VDTSIAHAADVAVGRYDLTYRSPSAGQTLTVSFTASDESPGVVAVQAASLTIGQASASQTPTNLQASVAGQNVVLRWDAPHTGAPTVGYIVEAGSATGLRDLLVAPTGSTATTLSAAAPDGIYHVRVRAVTAAGVSEPSNEVVVQVGCAAAPDAVSQLDVEIAGDLVTLTWETSAGASGYVVQVGSATGLSNLAVIPVSAPALVTHAPPGTYFVRVAARNACGVSMLSNEVVVGVTSAR
jgi:hypothetical protein